MNGPYTAELVAARLSGFPDPLVSKYAALGWAAKYAKRNIFAGWVALVADGMYPSTIPYDWLNWGVLKRYEKMFPIPSPTTA
jgi:hypothetical protein